MSASTPSLLTKLRKLSIIEKHPSISKDNHQGGAGAFNPYNNNNNNNNNNNIKIITLIL